MTDNSGGPDVSELRQWSLLRQLHENGGGKLGAFLRENNYPWDAAQKPLGKYYAQIRNKNVRLMAIPVEKRLEFIDGEIGLTGSGIGSGNDRCRDNVDDIVVDVKQLPTVNRMKLIDILASLPVDGKRKIIAVLKDLAPEEQEQLIGILGGI
jgi:hypothetical protein